MVENIKMLVLETNPEAYLEVEKVSLQASTKCVHVMDGLAAIGLFRSSKYKLVLINADPFFKPEGLRKTMTFLRFANRSSNLEIGAYGVDISPSTQLTLLDFGVKSFLNFPIKEEELVNFVNKVTDKEDFAAKINSRKDEFGDNYPLDVYRIMKLANDDSSFVKVVFESFVEEVPEYFSELLGCVSDKNTERISQLAHKIKSPLNIVGVQDFIDMTEFLEEEVEKAEIDWAEVTETAKRLNQKFEEAYQEVFIVLGK